MTKPSTLADLRQTDWAEPAKYLRTVKDELRQNLVRALESGTPIFPGIVGYEDTVVPQVVNAVLARHNFILLGLRGQAKSRILRQLVTLLDDEIPILAGSEVNDNPFAPISKYGRQLVEEHGDAHADCMGDARLPLRREAGDAGRDHRGHHRRCGSDQGGARRPPPRGRADHPLRAAAARATAASSRSTSCRTWPARSRWACSTSCRKATSRSKAIPIRLALDVLLVFTANPEDYTARGKIITPLKDRIGSEILTHYPASVDDGDGDHAPGGVDRAGRPPGATCPTSWRRSSSGSRSRRAADKRIDHRSGVSQRLPITVIETRRVQRGATRAS